MSLADDVMCEIAADCALSDALNLRLVCSSFNKAITGDSRLWISFLTRSGGFFESASEFKPTQTPYFWYKRYQQWQRGLRNAQLVAGVCPDESRHNGSGWYPTSVHGGEYAVVHWEQLVVSISSWSQDDVTDRSVSVYNPATSECVLELSATEAQQAVHAGGCVFYRARPASDCSSNQTYVYWRKIEVGAPMSALCNEFCHDLYTVCNDEGEFLVAALATIVQIYTVTATDGPWLLHSLPRSSPSSHTDHIIQISPAADCVLVVRRPFVGTDPAVAVLLSMSTGEQIGGSDLRSPLDVCTLLVRGCIATAASAAAPESVSEQKGKGRETASFYVYDSETRTVARYTVNGRKLCSSAALTEEELNRNLLISDDSFLQPTSDSRGEASQLYASNSEVVLCVNGTVALFDALSLDRVAIFHLTPTRAFGMNNIMSNADTQPDALLHYAPHRIYYGSVNAGTVFTVDLAAPPASSARVRTVRFDTDYADRAAGRLVSARDSVVTLTRNLVAYRGYTIINAVGMSVFQKSLRLRPDLALTVSADILPNLQYSRRAARVTTLFGGWTATSIADHVSGKRCVDFFPLFADLLLCDLSEPNTDVAVEMFGESFPKGSYASFVLHRLVDGRWLPVDMRPADVLLLLDANPPPRRKKLPRELLPGTDDLPALCEILGVVPSRPVSEPLPRAPSEARRGVSWAQATRGLATQSTVVIPAEAAARAAAAASADTAAPATAKFAINEAVVAAVQPFFCVPEHRGSVSAVENVRAKLQMMTIAPE